LRVSVFTLTVLHKQQVDNEAGILQENFGNVKETLKLRKVDQTTGNNLNTETAKETPSLIKTDEISTSIYA
jgi:hypothetical protein